jgi:transposase
MMDNARFSYEFKSDAVRQMTEWGYPVAEVLSRLGVSQHSLYKWRKKFSKPATGSGEDDQAWLRPSSWLSRRSIRSRN